MSHARVERDPPVALPDAASFDFAAFGEQHLNPKVQRIIVGLGAPKCGTTWLFDALSQHREIHRAPAKEVKFWNQFVDGGTHKAIASRFAKYNEVAARWGWLGQFPVVAWLLRRELRARRYWVESYRGPVEARMAAYLKFLQVDFRGQPNLLDITPAYFILRAPELRALAGLQKDPRFIFLMREPASRSWSAAMFGLRRSGLGAEDIPAAAADALRRKIAENHPGISKLRYAPVIDAIREAGLQDRSMCIFYEELFQPDTHARIADFLGLDNFTPDGAKKVNVNKAGRPEIPEDIRHALIRGQAGDYDAVEAHMGYLPPAWTKARACASGAHGISG